MDYVFVLAVALAVADASATLRRSDTLRVDGEGASLRALADALVVCVGFTEVAPAD